MKTKTKTPLLTSEQRKIIRDVRDFFGRNGVTFRFGGRIKGGYSLKQWLGHSTPEPAEEESKKLTLLAVPYTGPGRLEVRVTKALDTYGSPSWNAVVRILF